jgi:hypothetical protein
MSRRATSQATLSTGPVVAKSATRQSYFSPRCPRIAREKSPMTPSQAFSGDPLWMSDRSTRTASLPSSNSGEKPLGPDSHALFRG